MTIPRILLAVALAVALYLFGANADQRRTRQIIRSARAAWRPEAKKDRKRLQKIAKRSAKKVTKALY